MPTAGTRAVMPVGRVSTSYRARSAARPQWPNHGDRPLVVVIVTVSALLGILTVLAPFVPRFDDVLGAPTTSQAPSAGAAQAAVPQVAVSQAGVMSVRIAEPQERALVGQYADVVFEEVGQDRAGLHRVLLVRDPIGQYWSWGLVAPGERKRVQLGEVEDRGQPFEIGILTAPAAPPRGRPLQERPTGPYVSVTVTRR